MTVGLNVARVVNVEVNISPVAAQFANFNSLLIVGDSNVINTADRIRSYNDIDSVAADFGTSAPEYLAALIYFSQVPSPEQLYIGRWAQAATHGLLVCGPLTAAQQLMTAWTGITTGRFKIAVDGGGGTDTGNISFAAQTNLNGVASQIQIAVRLLGGAYAAVTVTWDSVNAQFTFGSGTTGTGSSVAVLTSPAGGVDISAQLKGTVATYEETVQGIAAETALQAVTILDANHIQWYGLMFASTNIVDADHLAIAAFIEAAGQNDPHIYGLTTAEAAALTTNDTTSIGYQLKQLSYRRTFVIWSSASLYAAAGIFGRGVTVDFNANNSVITFMWKIITGVAPELLTATQANALDSTNYNYYATFKNNTSIVVNGKLVNGDFIDNTWNLDWYANQIQTDVYNVLYTTLTKVPQTNAGNHLLKTAMEAASDAAVNNGTLAPGTWNSGGFGQLKQGDFLPKGYYVFQPPIESQPQANREARISVPFQIAAKLAGAVHTVNITVNVNR